MTSHGRVIFIFSLLLSFQCLSCLYSNILQCFESYNLFTITPNDELYSEISKQLYTSGTVYKAKGFVRVQSASDVKKAIRCAKKTNTHVSIKSGGHSLEGYSFGSNNSWIIDLSEMKNIKINHFNSTVTIESGVTTDIIEYLNKQNYVIPTGIGEGIGLSGLALGGGIGLLGPKHGITVDQLESLEMVTVDGKIRHVSRNHYPDLFWAVRGGGGGNFGVVTKLNLKIYTAPSCILWIQKTYNHSFAGELLYLWENYFFTIKDAGSMYSLLRFNGENGVAIVDFTILTETKSQCDSVAEDIIENFPGITEKDIVQLENYFAAHKRNIPAPSDSNKLPWCHISMNFLLKRRLNRAETQEAIDLLYGSDKRFSMALGSLGGKINDVKRTETAYVHRDAKFFVDLFSHTDCSDEAKCKLKQLFESYRFMDTGESYQNFISKLQGGYLHRYYGENLGRLMHIKRKYDPENFFCFPQSIPPSLSLFSNECPFNN